MQPVTLDPPTPPFFPILNPPCSLVLITSAVLSFSGSLPLTPGMWPLALCPCIPQPPHPSSSSRTLSHLGPQDSDLPSSPGHMASISKHCWTFVPGCSYTSRSVWLEREQSPFHGEMFLLLRHITLYPASTVSPFFSVSSQKLLEEDHEDLKARVSENTESGQVEPSILVEKRSHPTTAARLFIHLAGSRQVKPFCLTTCSPASPQAPPVLGASFAVVLHVCSISSISCSPQSCLTFPFIPWTHLTFVPLSVCHCGI